MKIHHLFNTLLVIFFLFSNTLIAQTKDERNKITSSYNKQKINNLAKKLTKKHLKNRRIAIKYAKENNLPITVKKDGKFLEIQKIENGKPIYYTTFNVDAAKSTRTDHLHSGGSLGLNLEGQNMTAHVWDGGLARSTHQEYDGVGGNNRFSIGDNSTTLNFHAAHVTGTIIASGVVASAKGMAPQARAIGYDWNNDTGEATASTGNGMLLSNHSYGYATRDANGNPQLPNYFFGGYIINSRDWDEIMFNAPNYLMVVAAGNDGNDNSANSSPLDGNSFYDKLTGHSTSKNSLVVANAQDANIDTNGNLISVSINSTSSEGPTDDYRIKPDITGNGTSVYSTYENSNTAYNSITGTSMASPNVTGSLILLQQQSNNVTGSFLQAATLKGLVLHTADDAGSNGPDAIFGWGLLNTKRASEVISNNGTTSKIEELTLNNGQNYQITVTSDGVNDLLASISWTDRPGTATTTVNSNTPVLVNDLDIRITKNSTTYSPWRLTGVTTNGKGDNNVDPYERVDVSNANGTYTITVTHKGTLVGGNQNFSLIITGIVQTASCVASTPTNINVGSVTDSSALVSWNAISGTTYDLRYKQTGASVWTSINVTNTSTTLTGLIPQTQYEVQLRSKCPDNSVSSYSNSVLFTTQNSSGGSSCINGITSFPYNEGFENTLGAWTQSTNDDINWTIDSNGTPSSGTGPSNASQGNYYIYVEASGYGTGYPNKQAILNSPCYDLSNTSSANFSFKYHIYGSTDMGTISLEASIDNGNSWTSIWSKSGNKGNSWLSANVDLSAYAGESLQLRFNRVTSSTWQADIAIDDVKLTTNSGSMDTTVSLSITFDNYPEETSWEIQNDSGQIVTSGGPYGSQADGSTININTVLPTGCYSLIIKDSYGDGICCGYGSGSYTLTDTTTNQVLASGGSFNSSDTTSFCVGGATQNSNYIVESSNYNDVVGFNIYPNPVFDFLNISVFGTEAQSYEIINTLGQVVIKGNYKESINVYKLKSGIYILKLNIGEKHKIKQFIKQ